MKKRQSGYSLVEVLVAIAITAVVLLTVITLFYMGRRNVYSGKQTTQAVSIGTTSHPLPQPFFVLATQNPIELEGTYPLPEAELDRFFFKLNVGFPTREELSKIVDRTTGPHIEPAALVTDGSTVLELQEIAREVPLASHVSDYAVRLVLAVSAESTDALMSFDARRSPVRLQYPFRSVSSV